MKAFFLSLFALALAIPASATVSIEFQLGGIDVPAGSIGVLVADVDGDGDFTSPTEAEGAQLTYSAMIGGDVIIAVFSQSGLADWGTQKGFAAQMAVLDYASLDLAEGDDLMLHIFPQRTEGQTIRAGEPHLSYRTDEIGQRTSNSTMGFSLPADGGAHLLAVIGPDQQGNADLSSLDLRNLPYASGSGSFDRTLSSPTARHTYYFELGSSGFLSLQGIGATGLVVQLIGPDGQPVYTGGGAEFGLYDTLASGLYTLVLSREGGSGELAYELDFANSDVRFVVPDVAVGARLTTLSGNNVLNGASGQSATLISSKAKSVSGFATVANRGALPDTLAVRGTAGNALCGIAYFDGATNVTAAMVAGTYRTAEIDDNDEAVSLRVQLSPNKKKLTKKKKGKRPKILKKTFTTLVRADSTQGPGAMDAGSIRAQTK